jgi:hypothetical protein
VTVGDIETFQYGFVLAVAVVAATALAHPGTRPAEPPTIQITSPEIIAMSSSLGVHDVREDYARRHRRAWLVARLEECTCSIEDFHRLMAKAPDESY